MKAENANMAERWREQVRQFLEEHHRIVHMAEGLSAALAREDGALAFDHVTALQTRLYAHCAKENRFFQEFLAGAGLEGVMTAPFESTRRLAHDWAAFQSRWMSRETVEADFVSFRHDVRHLLERLEIRVAAEEPIYRRILDEGE
ncbi:MAG: hypothetical protein HQL51_08340 [Magnetococcales bacterium]|nr:hypothetical protein [Magnetococcales bacterium]